MFLLRVKVLSCWSMKFRVRWRNVIGQGELAESCFGCGYWRLHRFVYWDC